MVQSRPHELLTASLTDAVFDSVRHRIVSGEIAAGERLTEARLAEDYSIARPTARAAVERLVSAGLLVRTMHKSAYVPHLEVDDIRDIFFAREAVEVAAVRALVTPGAGLEQAERAHAEYLIINEQSGFSQRATADRRFHSALVADAGSPRLSRMHGVILGEIEMTMGRIAHGTVSAESVAAEHEQILAAIRAGDEAAATDAMRTHLSNARIRVLRGMDAEAGIDEPVDD